MSAFSFKWRFWRQHSIKMIYIPILTSKGTTIHFISYFVDFSRFTPLVTVLPPQCTCSCEWRNCDVCTKLFYCCSLAPPIQCLHFGPTHCITCHLAQPILLPYGPVVFIVVQQIFADESKLLQLKSLELDSVYYRGGSVLYIWGLQRSNALYTCIAYDWLPLG